VQVYEVGGPVVFVACLIRMCDMTHPNA